MRRLLYYWNGVEIYQGTHCWTEYGSTGPGGGVYTGGEYDPGCSYPGGGGTGNDYGTPSSPSVFSFSNLGSIYAFGSSLDLKDKISLEGALNGFRNASPIYALMFNLLIENKVKLKFGIDEETCVREKAQAYYSPDKCGIYFRGSVYIDVYVLLEEMIHAVQDQCFYEKNMDAYHKDCEFEAKVFQDLVNHLTDVSIGRVENIPAMTNRNPAFVPEYAEWIDSIYKMVFFPYTEVVNFRYCGNLWDGYAGVNIPTFIPKVINRYFGKAKPDHQ